MLNNLNMSAEHLGGNNDPVDHWLQDRRDLLVSYYHLAGLKPNKDCFMALNEKALNAFCQCLVDYLSAGHFNIYERVIKETAQDDSLRATSQIYPALQANTSALMKIYDTHLENAINHDNYHEFQTVLSRISEILEARFMLEDKLVQLAFKHNPNKPRMSNGSHFVDRG